MSGFARFRHEPALEAALTFAGWQGRFTEADRDADLAKHAESLLVAKWNKRVADSPDSEACDD